MWPPREAAIANLGRPHRAAPTKIMKKQLKRLDKKAPAKEPAGLTWFDPETGECSYSLTWKPDGKGGFSMVEEYPAVNSPEQK